MMTRAEYLKISSTDPDAHRRYYGQFVSQRTINTVLSVIGKDTLLNSKCPNFNDIPLNRWDAIVPYLPGSGDFVKAGDYYTLAGGVCLAKEAARQWVESQTKGDE